MGRNEIVESLNALPEAERAGAVAEVTRGLGAEGKKTVVEDGIGRTGWPQESMHRMITILGCVFLALCAAAMAVWADTVDANEVGTALVAVSTAIVGGIFGYAQGTK